MCRDETNCRLGEVADTVAAAETRSWSTCGVDPEALGPGFGPANTDAMLTIQHMKQQQLTKLELTAGNVLLMAAT